jgi:transposase
MFPCYIKEKDWAKIYKYLQERGDIYVGKLQKSQRFVEGVWYVLRGGVQWRLVPSWYGKWRSLHKRFREWCEKGVWKGMLEHFSKDSDMEYIMIDATIVRAHSCASGYQKGQNAQEGLGRSAGGFTSKIHAMVDSLGNLLKIFITPGQQSDITKAPDLIAGLQPSYVIGDKGYDCDAFVQQIIRQNAIPVIPPRSNRTNPRIIDKHIYKERHLVECFFNKVKNYRRIFSRFDKTSLSYESFFAFAGALIWLR